MSGSKPIRTSKPRPPQPANIITIVTPAPDPDGDSTMQSSPASSSSSSSSSASASDDLFPDADVPALSTANTASIPAAPSTPAAQATLSELSPPSSQGAPSLPNNSQTRDASINANGKRIHSTALAGGVPQTLGSHTYSGAGGGGAAFAAGTVSSLHHHAISAAEGAHRGGDVAGYTWDKESETPGYTWMNKKAMDEWAKAEDMIIEKDRMVRAKYGDPLEWAGREKKRTVHT